MTFNSLFEMPRATEQAPCRPVAPAAFNSLFEMREATARLLRLRLRRLSILYLRCQGFMNAVLSLPRELLSILYLRCAWAPPCLRQVAEWSTFNSLFEMRL